jgi:hypothetical protein
VFFALYALRLLLLYQFNVKSHIDVKGLLCDSKIIFPLQVSHYFKAILCASKQKEYLCFTNYNFLYTQGTEAQ